MKRAHSERNGGDETRSKRRREIGVAGSSSDVEMPSSSELVVDEQRVKARIVNVREEGMKLWQTVRDAVSKDGRLLAIDFIRKPSKKLYPDYYQLIQHPIALEDIKKQLESNVYPTLEAVRQDFELCFENAKSYNMKESLIYRDAKDLLKLANKTYHRMVPTADEGEPTGKKPSVHRLAKTRLSKIMEKTDDTGRILSSIFFELPSKKEWAFYYTVIKQPRCLDAIMKKVKRKEYATMTDFADDVELVFSNAMEFNLDHTQIWEDALTLQTMFRELMSDLPPAFAVARYQKPLHAKIKIKMPVASSSSPPNNAAHVVLRVPVAPKATTPVAEPVRPPTPTPPPKAVDASPALAPYTLPNTNSIPHSNAVQPPPQLPTPAPPPAPPTFINTTPVPTTQPFNHYPQHVSFRARTSTPVPIATPAPAPPPPPVATPAPPKALSMSNSPAPPPIPPSHMLKGVALLTDCNRPFLLDHQDGVKVWAMRLSPSERALSVSDVTYMGDGEEDDSDLSEEEEEEGSDEDEPKKGKGKGRGRGKPKAVSAAVKALQVARAAKREARKIGEVQVKLNGNVVAPKVDDPGFWMVDLQAGLNCLEVGEKGGLIWKVFADRVV